MARSSDDVFLAEEESESFKQQVEVSFLSGDGVFAVV